MSIFDDDLQYRNVAGTADMNDLIAPGNYFVEDVFGTNLPLEEAGYLTVREQQGRTSLFQSYLGQQSSRLFTRTATGGFNGETDTIVIASGAGEPVTATITPRTEGLSFYAAGGNLSSFESNVTGTDTMEGTIVLAMDTSPMGGITVNGSNAIMIWGGTAMIMANTISTDCGTFVIESASATTNSVEIRFRYQWTAEMGRERSWSEWQRCYCNCPPAIQIVTISFDAKGGSPIPNTILVVPGQAFTVPAGPTKEDYAFNGWKAQGTGMVYQPGQTVNTNVNMHLVAQWEEMSAHDYTLSFDSAGGTPIPANIVVTIGMSAVLPAAPSKDGYSFTGWRDTESGTLYQLNRQITPESSMHLVAQWQQIGDQQEGEINVYFLTEGADYPILMAAEPHTDITLPAYAPQMEGHTFEKWLSDDFTTEYMPGDTIHMGEGSIYLSAVWHIRESWQTTEKMLKATTYLASTVEVFENNLTVQDPVYASGGTLNFDWGDGTIERLSASGNPSFGHTYARPGCYKVRMWSENQQAWVGFKRLATRLTLHSDQLVSIDYYKTRGVGSGDYMAAYQTRLAKINCPIFWKGAPNMWSVDYAFLGCLALSGQSDFTAHAFNQNSACRTWMYAFKDCISLDPAWSKKAFSNQPQVTSTAGIFENCNSMTQAPLNFCAGSPLVTGYSYAFSEARNLKNLPLNFSLNSISATGSRADAMFQNCHSVEGNAMDIISRVGDWQGCVTSWMFAGCTNLSDYDSIPGRFL